MSNIFSRLRANGLATVATLLIFTMGLTACENTEANAPTDAEDVGDVPEEQLPEDVDVPDIPEQPEEWSAEDLNCEEDADCMDHESCLDGVCQIDRCTAANYESLAPLGDSYLFYADLELAITDTQAWSDEYWVDRYSPSGEEVDYDGSINVGAAPPLDVAGGDLLGNDEETYAVVFEGVGELFSLDPAGMNSVPLPLLPRAIAAGDIHSESVDELYVAGSNRFAVCDLALGYCQPFDLDSDVEIIDLAIGDIDGDVLREVIFLLETSTGLALLGVNFDSNQTRQEEDWLVGIEDDTHRIAAGDLDGDGRAEIVTIQEGGWWNQNDDELDLYRLVDNGDSQAIERAFHQEAGYNRLLDIDIGDVNADDEVEIILLDEHQKVYIARLDGDSIEMEWTSEFTITGTPGRIATADHDANSPRAVLQSGPEVVPGASVPVVAMLLPPYSHEHSAGFSSAAYGSATTTSENFTDTVSMNVGMDVGTSTSFFGLFDTKYSSKVSYRASMTLGEGTTMRTGSRNSIRSQPEDFGFHYGAVVVSWGCFHAYTYEVQDSSNLVPGSEGETVVLTIPVDKGTAMMSTDRYNALALAVGDLPVIDVPYEIGDPFDYPTEPETIYGDELESDSMVFPNLEWHEVSDIGYVGWANSVGTSVSNSTSHGISMGSSVGITVAGINVGLNSSSGWGSGYSLRLGENASFSGGIPPFRDDPDTDADEYVENFFRVAPIVYMQDYTDSNGETSAFYVQTYVIDY